MSAGAVPAMPPGQAPNPRISVAIPTRNRGAAILPALESVLADRSPVHEVLIVDQSTDDRTRRAIDGHLHDPRVRYVASQEQGRGKARNVALREAVGDVVVYTDDDCTVPQGWAAVMAAPFVTRPRVGMVFCNVDAAPHDEQAGFVPTYHRTGDKVVRGMLTKCRARGIGAGMAVRREAALAAGGFDPVIDGAEDGDLAVRLLIARHHVYETDAVAVVHDGFRSFAEGRDLAKRNWTQVGLSYVKPLRGRHLPAVVLVAYEGLVLSLLRPLVMTVLTRRRQGIRNFLYFWSGFRRGLRLPLDAERLVYKV